MNKSSDPPKKIGIRFSDNDFRSTIRAFLFIISNDKELALPWETLAKEHVVWMFHKQASNLYWTCQNRGWQKIPSAAELAHIEGWLHIDESNVYFDEEVYEFLEGVGWGDNGEFHYVDLEQNLIFTV